MSDEKVSHGQSSLDFEVLAAELLAEFIETPSREVDRAIEWAQKRVCDLLGLDLSSLWQWQPGSQRYFRMTHLYRPAGGPPVPGWTDSEENFPWCTREIRERRSYAFRCMDEFPPEARLDRECTQALGIRSCVAVPLSTGGGPVLGGLQFGTTGEERSWPADVVRRLQLVGRIFAGALGRMHTDEALRRSEERLKLAAESAGVGLWELDLVEGVFWVTDHAERIFRLPPGKRVTRETVLSPVVPEDRDRVVEALQSVVEGEQEVTVEYRVRTTGGKERWLSARGRARRGPDGKVVSVLGVALDVTGRKRSESALRDLSQRLIQAHEEERALLARDLHDDLSQRLAALAIDVGKAELGTLPGPQAAMLTAVREGLVGLSEDVHSLAYQLHPSVLEELGLAEALRTECERFRRQGRGELAVDLCPERVAIGADAELCLFRVAQEALNNVQRHAEASAVSVSLRQRDGGLLLTVSDDGAGFDPAAQRGRKSLGLSSMRERVGLVGGTLSVDSAPGEGTAVSAWVGSKAGPG